MTEQWIRTEMLIGPEGMEILSNSSVIIFGVGGVGSFTVEALARVGIGRLVLVDHDLISPSNLNRQLPALQSTLGQPKVEILQQRVRDINPQCQVKVFREFYQEDNREMFFQETYSYVVDAIDSVPSKVDLIAYAYKLSLKIVSSMGAGNRLDPIGFRQGDISETFGCPLAKVVRKRLRQQGIVKGVKTVFSPKPSLKPSGEGAPGSISFVPPVVGMILASVVVNDLLQKNKLQ